MQTRKSRIRRQDSADRSDTPAAQANIGNTTASGSARHSKSRLAPTHMPNPPVKPSELGPKPSAPLDEAGPHPNASPGDPGLGPGAVVAEANAGEFQTSSRGSSAKLVSDAPAGPGLVTYAQVTLRNTSILGWGLLMRHLFKSPNVGLCPVYFLAAVGVCRASYVCRLLHDMYTQCCQPHLQLHSCCLHAGPRKMTQVQCQAAAVGKPTQAMVSNPPQNPLALLRGLTTSQQPRPAASAKEREPLLLQLLLLLMFQATQNRPVQATQLG